MTVEHRKASFLIGYPTNTPPHNVGFSLIELMIAMVLGLLVIGAVGTVFVSAQQSYRIKANFEEAQEAFRFASHVINRLVQSSESIINPASTNNQLFVEIRGGPGIFDCTGAAVPAVNPNDPDDDDFRVTNAFEMSDGSLICDPDATPGDALTGIALVSGIATLNFSYADLPDDQAPLRTDYVGSTSITSWNNVRSVRTTITMDTGLEAFFTSTSRGAAIGDPITVE
ncbi:MAG: hypothetical protein R6U98_06515 [Pirellulaceae bacterium]